MCSAKLFLDVPQVENHGRSVELLVDSINEQPRDFALGGFRPVFDSVDSNQVNSVPMTAHDVPGNVVRDDPVRALCLALGDRLLDDAPGFGGKTDQQPWP